MSHSDQPKGKTLQKYWPIRYAGNRLSALPVILLSLTSCDTPPSATAEEASFACDASGRLETELYGAIRASIDWQSDVLGCEGMPRPDGEGARLRLSGSLDGETEGQTITFILGVPGLAKGSAGTEMPTNVTLVQEGTGRFFGTQDLSGCWTDIDSQEPLDVEAPSRYRISGLGYELAFVFSFLFVIFSTSHVR